MIIRKNTKDKQFGSYQKLIIILGITILLIVIVGGISYGVKIKKLNDAKAEINTLIEEDLQLCRKSLETIEADEYTKGLIDTYKQNIDNAEEVSEKVSITNSMLYFVGNEITLFRTNKELEMEEEISNSANQLQPGQAVQQPNYQYLEIDILNAENNLLIARNKIYNIYE